jgi:pyruvate,water dikinase
MDLQLLQLVTVCFEKKNNLEKSLDNILNLLDTKHYTNLSEVGQKARALILALFLRNTCRNTTAYQSLSKQSDIKNLGVAVRSSATAEDLPTASFAGQMQSSLILGENH